MAQSSPLTPNASPKDAPAWGLLVSLIIIALAGYAAYEFLQVERERRNSWGPAKGLPDVPRLRSPFKDQEGREFGLAKLRGKLSVVGFFFTRCDQSCPIMMQALQQLHAELAGQDVQFASISLEGSHDTVEVLKAYAGKLKAGADWYFLTGNEQLIRQAAKMLFFFSVEEDKKQPIGRHITHANRLYIFDKEGKIAFQMDVVRRADPHLENSPFVIDEAALRQFKIAILDLQQPYLGPGDLPHLNGLLNATAAILLLVGFAFIRGRMPRAHGATMAMAVLVSALFLASYLYYHWLVGDTKFTGEGLIRTVYFTILISHVFLAIVTVPLVLVTLWLAIRSRFTAHRRIARWTLPIWLYVSLSGIAVYWLLYQWIP